MPEVNPGPTNLESWWELNEESGVRVDSHGSNDLADNNTVLFATGKQGNAADFEAGTSEYLSIADNASVSTGDVDYYFGIWIKPETLPGTFMVVIGKYGDGPSYEYNLAISVASKGNFSVYDGATPVGNVVANSFGALSTATWYFLEGWHSATLNQVGVAVNRTQDVAATSGAPIDGNAEFVLGRRSVGTTFYFDGLQDECAFFKGYIPTADERDWLYNSGNGRTYNEIVFIMTPSAGNASATGVVPIAKHITLPPAKASTATGVAPTAIIKALATAGNALAVGVAPIIRAVQLLITFVRNTFLRTEGERDTELQAEKRTTTFITGKKV